MQNTSKLVYLRFEFGGKSFKVVDSPGAKSWNFWDFYSGGQWETTTIAEADRLLRPGDYLFDIGAWLGPLTLWEAKRGVRVLAVEPDPAAFADLKDNVLANQLEDLVTLEQLAVYDKITEVPLFQTPVGADSQSSLIRADLGQDVFVKTCTLSYLILKHGTPDVVKIDIEGGESIVFPEAGPTLREMNIPVLLALHPHWYAPGTADKMEEELSHWGIKDLRNSMYLCTPK